MVFIIWCVIFYYGERASNFNGLFQLIKTSLTNFDTKSLVVIGVAIALPIGVLIHQLSVVIKNWIVAKKYIEFSDHPDNISGKVDYAKDSNKYYLERISNLNSFYYVRIDNGVIAPTLAFLLIFIGFDISINCNWLILVLLIAGITVCYIKRIHDEIKIYRSKLEKVNPFRAYK